MNQFANDFIVIRLRRYSLALLVSFALRALFVLRT